MKPVGTKYESHSGNITIRFSDRCKEYNDAGGKIIPTCYKTIRVQGYLDYAKPVTNQILRVFGIRSGVFLDVNEILILN